MINADKLYEIRQHLFARNRGEINPGLERINAAAKELKNPQNSYKIVHVAGTNGKGSTASMIAQGLEITGEKVGLFTSPHILSFGERFRINGKIVSSDKWLDVYNDFKNLCDKHNLTFFEICALIAFELFRREECTWVVLETGMGGRLDATNICIPQISVITSIGIDHTDYLGNTLEKIANEKLGIVKRGVDLVISGANCENVINLAKNYCLKNQANCTVSDLSRINDFSDYKFAMNGDFQKTNFILALTAMEILGFGKNEKVIEAMTKTNVAARMQMQKIAQKIVIFDVAHNPQAMQKLAESVAKENLKKPLSLIFGMMNDKDTKESQKFVSNIAENIFCFTPATKRAQLADYIAYDFRELNAKNVFVCKTAKEALEKALSAGETVLVCGSFFVVSEVMAAANLEVL
ncbi:MAG: bifunctional folylpolyglutamate synthase/dihydrofolate synthase [Chitinivibrionia bacterium]|nr:bifunctional folylpolyglutamate synthase/dihydrofolate synthase [Chitinivibrionia bacterium]